MNEIEKILKALANKRRIAIIKHINSNKNSSVSDIAEAVKLSFRSTSRHLRILSGADIINGKQTGLAVMYSLSVPMNDLVRMVLQKL